MTPDELAAALNAAAETISHERALMHRIVLTVEGNAKRVTPVRTGTLRRSLTSRVETAARGIVGTNVEYAPIVHRRKPFLITGLDNSRAAIDRLLEQYGDGLLERVAS